MSSLNVSSSALILAGVKSHITVISSGVIPIISLYFNDLCLKLQENTHYFQKNEINKKKVPRFFIINKQVRLDLEIEDQIKKNKKMLLIYQHL